MDYKSALSYLKGLEKLGIRFRVDNTRELLESLGFSFSGDVVHVAGTNGKGSCASVLARILQEDGRKVGLYTSPELVDFTERIRVGGRQIPRRKFAGLAFKLKPLIDSMPDKPTFFEVTTALTLKYFADSKVDAMVLEVGMGGRLDSTNAVESKLALVTNVDLDHMQYLGSSIEEIAREKAGIVRGGGTLVTAAKGAALKVLEGECRRKNARIIRVGREAKLSHVTASLENTSFTVETPQRKYTLKSGLLGIHQPENIACAVLAAEELGASKKAIEKGVEKAVWPGRLQIVQKRPRVILDCGHNPAGVKTAVDFIRGVDYERLIVVAGFSKDKDYKKMISLLSSADLFIGTEYKSERSLKTKWILEHVGGIAEPDVKTAVRLALKNAGQRDLILVTGSIYVVGEAFGLWEKKVNI